MKQKRYTEEQIAFALRQSESGVTEVRRLKQLESEVGRLKQLVGT